MYIYINKDLIKCIAPKIENVSFDIDFFEYSEKRGYTTNNNTNIRPEFEKGCRKDDKEECIEKKNRIGISEDFGVLCNVEVVKRYINIEDVSSIKNNNFYYCIAEKIKEDTRIKRIVGRIDSLNKTNFNIYNNKFIINEEAYNSLIEIFENQCEVECLGYKINCLNALNDVFKIIAIYIE